MRTRATVAGLTSTATAIAASVQPGPASPWLALSRMRAWVNALAGATPRPIMVCSRARSSSDRTTMCRLRTSASCGGGIPRPHEHETEPHISQVTTDDLLVVVLVPLDGLVEDDVADVGVAPAEGLDRLVLELLVDGEEVLDLPQQVGRDLVDLVDVVPVGVGQGDDQQLLVRALVVGHVEHADDAGLDLAAGEGRLAQQDHGVERVAVLGQGVGDEAVVGRVVDGAEQHPVEADAARLVVELVLVAGSLGDLDHDVDGELDRWGRHLSTGRD